MEVRRRNVENEKSSTPNISEIVNNFDAFPKLPPECRETTVSGAGASIITFIIIALLLVSEVIAFYDSNLKFTYEVDRDHDSKLRINVDITVAMLCENVGADIVDSTGQNVEGNNNLEETSINFKMTTQEASQFNLLRSVNTYLRTEHHAIKDFLWKRNWFNFSPLSKSEIHSNPNGDACRLRGSFYVNKVAGNFHITGGKNVPLMGHGHAHMGLFMTKEDYNFSHRIHHLSFGDPVSGRVNPLDAEEAITNENMQMYQYFVQVVPTRVDTRQAKADTYQFAVTEKNRTIDHAKDSHGIPGIFIKYDVSSLKVNVKEEFQTFTSFLVRLAAILGGVFATTSMLKQLGDFVVELIQSRYKLGEYRSAPLDVPLPKQTLS